MVSRAQQKVFVNKQTWLAMILMSILMLFGSGCASTTTYTVDRDNATGKNTEHFKRRSFDLISPPRYEPTSLPPQMVVAQGPGISCAPTVQRSGQFIPTWYAPPAQKKKMFYLYRFPGDKTLYERCVVNGQYEYYIYMGPAVPVEEE
ncbi:MAG: hypothetical protein JWO00_172 [Candidatus Parcubacteria bacterium]|nr:hypothetical protein [Candidatus Parcubacteria bacterium]